VALAIFFSVFVFFINYSIQGQELEEMHKRAPVLSPQELLQFNSSTNHPSTNSSGNSANNPASPTNGHSSRTYSHHQHQQHQQLQQQPPQSLQSSVLLPSAILAGADISCAVAMIEHSLQDMFDWMKFACQQNSRTAGSTLGTERQGANVSETMTLLGTSLTRPLIDVSANNREGNESSNSEQQLNTMANLQQCGNGVHLSAEHLLSKSGVLGEAIHLCGALMATLSGPVPGNLLCSDSTHNITALLLRR
jgi:hypothetical protein